MREEVAIGGGGGDFIRIGMAFVGVPLFPGGDKGGGIGVIGGGRSAG